MFKGPWVVRSGWGKEQGLSQGLKGEVSQSQTPVHRKHPSLITSPIRYLRLPHGMRGSRCWKAFVRYVFRISMQTLERRNSC